MEWKRDRLKPNTHATERSDVLVLSRLALGSLVVRSTSERRACRDEPRHSRDPSTSRTRALFLLERIPIFRTVPDREFRPLNLSLSAPRSFRSCVVAETSNPFPPIQRFTPINRLISPSRLPRFGVIRFLSFESASLIQRDALVGPDTARSKIDSITEIFKKNIFFIVKYSVKA